MAFDKGGRMIPIKLTTDFGINQFHIMQEQFNHYSKHGMRDEFKERTMEDFRVQEKYLIYFLDDDKMARKYKMNEEDTEGFEIFNKQSDMCSVLKYFAERAY